MQTKQEPDGEDSAPAPRFPFSCFLASLKTGDASSGPSDQQTEKPAHANTP